MNILAEKITKYFIDNGITTEEMREANIYGVEIILGKILNYSTLIILALCNQNLIPIIFFMFVFFCLRGRTGGFHASRRINCYMGTIIMFFLVAKVVAPLINLNSGLMVLIVLISNVVIFLFAPINHPNLELSSEEIIICKNTSRWMVILFSNIAIMLKGLGIIPECMSYMVAGIGVDAGLLIFAKIKNRRKQYEWVTKENFEICKQNGRKRSTGIYRQKKSTMHRFFLST